MAAREDEEHTITDDRTDRVMGAVRQGWHSLGGGDAATCPGCPVCSLSEQVGGLDPAATEHLKAAAAHLLAAGRELLAVLGNAEAQPRGDAATDPAPAQGEQPPKPDDASGQTWTRISVSTRAIDEGQP